MLTSRNFRTNSFDQNPGRSAAGLLSGVAVAGGTLAGDAVSAAGFAGNATTARPVSAGRDEASVALRQATLRLAAAEAQATGDVQMAQLASRREQLLVQRSLIMKPRTGEQRVERCADRPNIGARIDDIPSPARRHFLGRTPAVATAAPFVAGAYGLLYGRLNLETTSPVIRLPKLPRAFDGFRICQLSDIHIGPFMPAEEIRKYAAIANAQKAEMIVLTGDFVSFDPDTQQAVVEALSSLRAPFGVYGCLGNHDAWAGVEDSISDLLRQAGVRMLRGTNAPIATSGESFNLIGVDFQSPRRFGPSAAVAHLLGNIEGLIDRGRVNILLSHNPDTFDRAAELGIELSLAGHTHGGQAALEFISPEIAPSRLVTPYVAGLFQKPGGQLYVNRGIGTTFVPIRIGAPPEITVYKLSRG